MKYDLCKYNDWLVACHDQRKVLDAMNISVSHTLVNMIDFNIPKIGSFRVCEDKGAAIKEGNINAIIYLQRNLIEAAKCQIYVK